VRPGAERYADMPAVAQFAGRLAAMKAFRGVKWQDIADAAGLDRNTIHSIRKKMTVPKLDTAQRIADYLEAPGLYDALVEIRTLTCEGCGVGFLVPTGSLVGKQRRRFCSAACQQRGVATLTKHLTLRRALFQLDVSDGMLFQHRSLVAAFCRRCSGEECGETSCELFSVTPLRKIVAKKAVA